MKKFLIGGLILGVAFGAGSFALAGTDASNIPNYVVTSTNMIRGDITCDGVITDADVNVLISYLFQGGDAPYPTMLADVDDSGRVDIADADYLISYLYRGGEPPVEYVAAPPEMCVYIKAGLTKK